MSIFIAGERILKLEYEFFKEEFEEIFEGEEITLERTNSNTTYT